MSTLCADEGRAYARLGQGVFSKIENSIKPTIAAVNGFALGGGCELSLACDIRLVGKSAKFGQPEVGLGITPGFAGTQRLPKIVGIAKAKELIFTGGMIDADEAKSIGLANHVYEDENLMESVLKMASKIGRNAELAVRYSKIAINSGFEVPVSVGNTIEEGFFGMCFATEDQKNGMEAFLNKEKYKFEGK
jgi:enoyl-CoA hydratase